MLQDTDTTLSIGCGDSYVKTQIREKSNVVESQNKDTIKVIPEVVIYKKYRVRSKFKRIVFAIYPDRNKSSLSKEFATKFKVNREIKIRSININVVKFVTNTPVKMEIKYIQRKKWISQ